MAIVEKRVAPWQGFKIADINGTEHPADILYYYFGMNEENSQKISEKTVGFFLEKI